jgi:hypothetical protein
LTKSEACQTRESPGFDRLGPFTATQVLGAMAGYPPSALATDAIDGLLCPKHRKERYDRQNQRPAEGFHRPLKTFFHKIYPGAFEAKTGGCRTFSAALA